MFYATYSIEMYMGYTIIYHQFVRVRVKEEPYWQGASEDKWRLFLSIINP